MYERFFAFGCSFTKYKWPTWADIIKYDLDIKSYNYGFPGLGNVGIANRILQADLTHKFTEKDLIIVIWSSWLREDRHNNDSWIAGGNVYNNDFYDKYFLKKYFNINDAIIKNSYAIITTNKIYKNNLNFQSIIKDPFYLNDLEIGDTSRLVLQFCEKLTFMKNVFINSNIYESYNHLKDDHPSVSSHLNYVKNLIYPELNLTLKKETEEEFTKIDNKLQVIKPKFLNKKIKNIWNSYNDL